MRRCRDRETFPTVSGPILKNAMISIGTVKHRGKPHKLEVVWGAIPGVLTAAAPHCGGFSANDARFVNEGSSVHCVMRDERGYDEVRRSSEDFALQKGHLYDTRFPARKEHRGENRCL